MFRFVATTDRLLGVDSDPSMPFGACRVAGPHPGPLGAGRGRASSAPQHAAAV